MADERVAQAVRVARTLLESEGETALSMRRLAEGMGIRAPSLYKHVPDKAALEVALVADGLSELGTALRAAGPDLAALAQAYRAWGLTHPHLYRLMTERPLPRERLPPGLEARGAEPLLVAAGGDRDAAWDALVAAFGR